MLEKIFELPFSKIILFFKEQNEEFLTKLTSLTQDITDLNIEHFKILYLNLDDKFKKILINNDILLSKIINAPKNKNGKTLFDLSNDDIKLYILEQLKNKNSNYTFLNLIKNLPEKLFKMVTDNLDYTFFFNSLDDLNYYIVGKYNVDKKISNEFINMVKNKQRNVYYLTKITNKIDFELFNHFNIIINSKIENNIIMLANGSTYNTDLISNINKKHLLSILNQIKKISNNDSDDKVLNVCLNMYTLFGYDNTMKIINNKFSNINDAALKRIAIDRFISTRKHYRLEHQDKFFSNNLLKEVLKYIKDNNFDFLASINSRINSNEQLVLKQTLTDNLNNANTKNEKEEIVTNFLKNLINSRELEFKENFINNYIKEYHKKHKKEKYSITFDDLYNLVHNIKFNTINLDSDGIPILDEDLLKLLLGNFKTNNDCLLRLILNKEAFDIHNYIDVIINNFPKVKSIINDPTNNLSFFSILDVIDVIKTLTYHIEPDEIDLTLNTIAKIIKSQDYCTVEQQTVLSHARYLHQKRKVKVASSIPGIKTEIKNKIKYKTFSFDDPKLITCGIDTKSCLKAGGEGEEFLEYCMTKPHSIIVNLTDEFNNMYICPFIRIGNMILGNGIDPEPQSEDLLNRLLDALKECVIKMMDMSNKDEKIEIATITDLHLVDFFNDNNFSSLNFHDINLPKEFNFYFDYTKPEIKNYILYQDKNAKPISYVPKKLYPQDRIPNYLYNLDCEIDKDLIEQQINAIYYHSINFRKLPLDKKNSLKRNYKSLNISDFKQIIGNKDWFIAIDENENIVSCCLPYDPRARIDYLKSFSRIKDTLLEERGFCK